jgi:DNA-binding transcriptional MerR regulator
MNKSSNAFRTISEVASYVGVEPHVLRFWESKFTQISPLKRGGGRRYYRPKDVDIIKGICVLLHTDGFSVKGVQNILKSEGVKGVIARGTDIESLVPEDTLFNLDEVEIDLGSVANFQPENNAEFSLGLNATQTVDSDVDLEQKLPINKPSLSKRQTGSHAAVTLSQDRNFHNVKVRLTSLLDQLTSIRERLTQV